MTLTALRTFEAVARRLSFSAAAAELFLTQSSISRQIKALEDELGTPLFNRGTRQVQLTSAGESLRQAVLPALERLDLAVRQIRVSLGRRHLNVSTFASLATLWLLPRLDAFQKRYPDIDIRISASDGLVDMDDPDFDVVLRCMPVALSPAGGDALFDEVMTPVVSPALWWRVQRGEVAPMARAADLAAHVLLEADEPDNLAAQQRLSWRRWLAQCGCAGLEPRRWIYLNFAHQHVQGALAAQGVALARQALVQDLLDRGELVEPFGSAGRQPVDAGYWLLPLPGARLRPELQSFLAWVRNEALATRAAMAAAPADDARRAS